MNKICYILTVPVTVRAFFIPQLKYLSENGFDVSVICSSDDSLQSELGEKIHFIPVDMPRGLSIFKSISVIRKLIKIFKQESFNFIQYSTPNAALYGAIAAKICRVKIRNYHLMGFRYLGAKGILKVILKFLEKITCRLSSSIECVSKSNLELGVAEGIFAKNKATVVWNGSTGGIDLGRFSIENRTEWRNEIRNKLGYSKNDFIYGFVGRITKDKGIDELLEAFLNSAHNAKLLMVGEFENEQELNQELLSNAKSNNQIKFVGAVNDVEKYFAAIDMLVLPSYREGFGNVVIESAAMGTPAIVSDIPGPRDAVIPNKTAILVPPNNTMALENIFSTVSKETIKSLGKEAADFSKNNFDQNILNKYILERKNYLLSNIC
uniref:glycosyltransferase family 4 protein n=1 Tax=Eubacterium sp. TaxID=142586 RepID=UPI004027C512